MPPDRTLHSLVPIDSTYLPTGLMRQVSRVTSLVHDSITGEMDLGDDHWVYALHGKVHRKRNLNFGTVTIFERSREVAAIEVVLAVIGAPGAVTPNQA